MVGGEEKEKLFSIAESNARIIFIDRDRRNMTNRELYSFVGKTLYNLNKEYNKKKKFAKCYYKESIKEIAEILKQELETKNIFWSYEECENQAVRNYSWFADKFEVLGRENVKEKNGEIRRTLNGKLHSYSLPALEQKNGYKEWRINGILHRIDGPAVEYSDGRKEYWISGREIYDFIKYGLGRDFTILKTTEKSHLITGTLQVPKIKKNSFDIDWKEVEICEWIPKEYYKEYYSDEELWDKHKTEFLVLSETTNKIKILLEDKIKEYKIPGIYDINKNIGIKIEDY